MRKFISFIILIYYLSNFCDSGTLPGGQQMEQTLITSLLNGYNKNIRPDETVSVLITATLQQIVTLDEKQQIMTSSSFISQSWYDDRLSWTPSSYNDTEVVMLSVKSLWIPDTMILNSADPNGYLTVSDYSLASVLYTGQVYMILPALTVKTRCSLYVQMFPFDKQTCSIDVTSWAQGDNRIAYIENDSYVIDISQYSEHPLWKLVRTDMTVKRLEDRVPFEWAYNNVISIQLYLQRKPLFYILNGIFACLVLNCVTLLSFMLAYAVQITLCMTCFMTYSVYSLNFSNLFPQQSEYMMMITLYFLLSICWTLISMTWFVLCNHFISKGEMPKMLYSFCGFLQTFPSSCMPKRKKIDETVKKKDVIAENGDLKKTENQVNPEATTDQAVSTAEPVVTENISTDQHTPVDNKEINQTKPIETAPVVNTNETIEKKKPKCNFCNRCEACQCVVDNDKIKAKNKKDIEAKCGKLNYFVLFIVLILIVGSNLILWLTMAK